jgi:hypothetical protein
MKAGASHGPPLGSATGETDTEAKHVVARVDFAKDVGSTPTASTICNFALHRLTEKAKKICPGSLERHLFVSQKLFGLRVRHTPSRLSSETRSLTEMIDVFLGNC